MSMLEVTLIILLTVNATVLFALALASYITRGSRGTVIPNTHGQRIEIWVNTVVDNQEVESATRHADQSETHVEPSPGTWNEEPTPWDAAYHHNWGQALGNDGWGEQDAGDTAWNNANLDDWDDIDNTGTGWGDFVPGPTTPWPVYKDEYPPRCRRRR